MRNTPAVHAATICIFFYCHQNTCPFFLRFVQDVGCASFSRDRGYRIVKFDINMNIFVRVNRPRTFPVP